MRGRVVERCEDSNLVTCDPSREDCPDSKYFVPGKGLSDKWWSNTWTMKNGREMRCIDSKFAGKGPRRQPDRVDDAEPVGLGPADPRLVAAVKEVNRSLMPSLSSTRPTRRPTTSGGTATLPRAWKPAR